ncbi:YbgC/FadM family acyl-CoA thioesterase [Bacillus hwajinpoensis]|uniref:YbgC/FadM family acyl-CoA thioesterase n=1 Tax=Guptibacillus hwajinpoensis TaxID=208199 RepID=A0A845EZI2_9BACL|nr:thioesterase family protein [Pseudalkalibacillus hwajinpoensis]MYL63895.1 YbgC/FadM family acyl-CoA thioesterase [Pseudalkalibacillus hwajinpoensis]
MYIATTSIDVRYAETDQMGVVYHANYLIWFELGRTALINDLGFRYADMEKEGILSPVMDIKASYKHPVRYGDEVSVKTWVDSYDGLRVNYGYEVINGDGDICVTGESMHTCVKRDTFRPVSIRRKFPEWHQAYENAKKQPAAGAE